MSDHRSRFFSIGHWGLDLEFYFMSKGENNTSQRLRIAILPPKILIAARYSSALNASSWA